MRNNEDDKYTRDGDDCSQVRNIINQLNNDNPSREKSREVVVRADGTKVVRVTKKRRVMVSSDEKKRRSRKKLLISLLSIFVVIASITAFYFFRMSTMCSASYLEEKKQELCAAWGAASIELKNPRIEGMSLEIDGIVAVFPEASMIERVELTGISAPIDMASFFSGVFSADQLKVRVANVRLRPGCDSLVLPRWNSENPIFKVKSYTCDKFSCSIGTPETSPIVIRDTELQIHKANGADVLTFGKGELQIAGISRDPKPNSSYKLKILDGKLFITSVSIEDIIIRCQDPSNIALEGDADARELSRSGAKRLQTPDIVLCGRIAEGGSLFGPYEVEIDRMPFSLITYGVFDRILSAENVSTSTEEGEKVLLTISPEGKPAIFTGKLLLTDVKFKDADLHAQSVYRSHFVLPNHARNPQTINFSQATVNLLHEDGKIVLDAPANSMVENGSVDLRVTARITVGMTSTNGQWNDLPVSGFIDYSFPKNLFSGEYENDEADPIFVSDPSDDFRWLFKTKLSGVSQLPEDDSREQVKNTENERARLKRRNIEATIETINRDETQTEEQPQGEVLLPGEEPKKQSDDSIFTESIYDSQPPSAPSNNAGATVPVDSSIKF